MASIQDIINRLESIRKNINSVPEIVSKVVEDNKDVILSLNRDQMLLGRDTEGEVLSPSYLQDPYFKSQEAAQAYARMKYALESQHNSYIWNPQLYPDKDRNTPNLIVRGDFQNAMFITANKTSYTIGSTYIDSPAINSKYKNRIFGLAPKSKEYFYREWILPALINALNKK